MTLRSKVKKRRQYEKESFHARLQMEKKAQAETAARLQAVEILMKNQGRIK